MAPPINMKFGIQRAIGLDIGRDAIKVVRAERRRNGKVVFTHAAMLRLPGETATLTPIVQRWLDSLGLRGEPCIISIPGRSIILKPMEIEAGDPRTTRQVAELEVEKLGKLTNEEVIFDVAEVPGPAGTRTVLLFMVRPDALDATLELPLELGLEIRDVIPSCIAHARLARDYAPSAGNDPVVILDIGHKTTELTVGARDGLRFFRSFDIGAGRFAEALAKERDISVVQANDLLLGDAAIPDPDDPPSPLTDTAKAWLAEVELSLDIYRDRFPNEADALHAAILTGGGGRLKGLPELLARHIPLKASVFPAVPLPAEDPDGATYSLAAGLALSGIAAGPAPVSLAPPAMRERRSRLQDRWLWTGAAGILLAAVLTFITGSNLATAHAQRQAEETRRQAEILGQLRAQLAYITVDNSHLLSAMEPACTLARNRQVILELLNLSAETKGAADWLVSLSTVPGTNNLLAAQTPASDAATNAPVAGLQFVLRGYTPDARFYSVRNMIARLQKSPLVLNADLLEEPAGKEEVWSPFNAVPFTLCVQTRPTEIPELRGTGDGSGKPSSVISGELATAIRDQERFTRLILSSWSDMNRKFSTFKKSTDLFNLAPGKDASLIDFRVAYQETQRLLSIQAKQLNIAIPHDLGLRDITGRDKNVRHLLLQLATIQKLVGITLDQGVSSIVNLVPLDPEPRKFGSLTVMEQYPVRITLKCTLPVLVGVLREMGNPEHFMAIRQAAITRADITIPDLLNVTMEVTSLVFPDMPDAATLPVGRDQEQGLDKGDSDQPALTRSL